MKVAIVSCKFSPGHVAHLKAFYKLCTELGYSAAFYFDNKYVNYINADEYLILNSISELYDFSPEHIIIQSPAIENITFLRKCRRLSAKTHYILHEPFPGFKNIANERSYAFKFLIATFVNSIVCKMATDVWLPSHSAIANYKKYLYLYNNKFAEFPLIFLDGYIENKHIKREYCSMIGGYSPARASDEFLEFVKYVGQNELQIKLQIATRSSIADKLTDPIFKKMIESGQLVVQQGHPLTSEEIDLAYRKSICTWNAYRRSTQSGVLPNAFMQGTPVIATHVGSFDDYVITGETGEFIEDYDPRTIVRAYSKIQKQQNHMSCACRKSFLEHWNYKKFENLCRQMFS